MKTRKVTIRLDDYTDHLLTILSKQCGRSKSELARDALSRQLRINQFEELRKKIMPFAKARGFLTDENIFRIVS